MNQSTIKNCDSSFRQLIFSQYIHYHSRISYEKHYYLNLFGYRVLDKHNYLLKQNLSKVLLWHPNYQIFLLDRHIPFKISMDHSSPTEWLDNIQCFEGNLHLIHQWDDECSFPNSMTKNARSPVTSMLDGDNCWFLNDIDSFNKLTKSPRPLIIIFFNIIPLSFLYNM